MRKNKDGFFEVPNLYDISDSAHWFNKVDNGLTVYLNYSSGIVDVHVQKVRFKFLGRKGLSSFKWDEISGRYTEIDENGNSTNTDETVSLLPEWNPNNFPTTNYSEPTREQEKGEVF